MAKLSFTKLGLKANQEMVEVHHNEQVIEVKQYIPVNNKLELIYNVINMSADGNNFANPLKVEVYFALEIIEAYTNISFTEKQKEDIPKLYDLFVSNGVYDKIVNAIPQDEYFGLRDRLFHTLDMVYKYQNSVMGILENISADYSNLNLDASEIQQKLADPENMKLLKDVLTKLG